MPCEPAPNGVVHFRFWMENIKMYPQSLEVRLQDPPNAFLMRAALAAEATKQNLYVHPRGGRVVVRSEIPDSLVAESISLADVITNDITTRVQKLRLTGTERGQDTHVRILSDRGQPRVATNVKGPLQPYFSTTSLQIQVKNQRISHGTTLPQRVHRTNPPLHSTPLFTRLNCPLLCPTTQDQVRGCERGVSEFNQKTAHGTPRTRCMHPKTSPPHPLPRTFLNHQPPNSVSQHAVEKSLKHG